MGVIFGVIKYLWLMLCGSIVGVISVSIVATNFIGYSVLVSILVYPLFYLSCRWFVKVSTSSWSLIFESNLGSWIILKFNPWIISLLLWAGISWLTFGMLATSN